MDSDNDEETQFKMIADISNSLMTITESRIIQTPDKMQKYSFMRFNILCGKNEFCRPRHVKQELQHKINQNSQRNVGEQEIMNEKNNNKFSQY